MESRERERRKLVLEWVQQEVESLVRERKGLSRGCVDQ